MQTSIVLLTDYGLQDPYAGLLRGVIASIAPKVPVIDLTHGILPQNVLQASIYLESSYPYFPRDTVFVAIVDPGVGTSRKILCGRNKAGYFLAPDNGLLTGVNAKEPFAEIRSVENPKYFLNTISTTFHGRDIFAPAAASLALKPGIFRSLGPKIPAIKLLGEPELIKKQNSITGALVYFDSFGNGITNIVRTSAQSSFWERACVRAGSLSIGSIQKAYGSHKKLIPLWNSMGRLEIALPKGSASARLTVGQKIKVIGEK